MVPGAIERSDPVVVGIRNVKKPVRPEADIIGEMKLLRVFTLFAKSPFEFPFRIENPDVVVARVGQKEITGFGFDGELVNVSGKLRRRLRRNRQYFQQFSSLGREAVNFLRLPVPHQQVARGVDIERLDSLFKHLVSLRFDLPQNFTRGVDLVEIAVDADPGVPRVVPYEHGRTPNLVGPATCPNGDNHYENSQAEECHESQLPEFLCHVQDPKGRKCSPTLQDLKANITLHAEERSRDHD